VRDAGVRSAEEGTAIANQPMASKRVEPESKTVPTPDADGSFGLVPAMLVGQIRAGETARLERM